ncbi:MAG: fibrillarin-like rRNA/tRNA 2'-O-methyltransferase [Candidatus Marsarchaeota archaeon]|nr:fibrillarin-like rRNA/tRNA 2'-O-methyltransferase [Candidatus Marsarchaeota archaeon]
MIKEIHEGVYVLRGEGADQLATANIAPGVQVYGERLVRFGGVEYRMWDPYRSKLGAAIRRGLHTLPIRRGSAVLYLGAASGTTASHVSDIVGLQGVVYAVEFSPRSMRELVMVSETRPNIVPILADARSPQTYRKYVSRVDAIYCDVAQPEQGKLAVDNARVYLGPHGWLMLAIKSRSIDVAADPRTVYGWEKKTLSEGGFSIEEEIDLEPFEKDHQFVVARYLHDANG